MAERLEAVGAAEVAGIGQLQADPDAARARLRWALDRHPGSIAGALWRIADWGLEIRFPGVDCPAIQFLFTRGIDSPGMNSIEERR